MSSSRRRRTATKRVDAAISATETPLENRIKEEVTARIKQRLGLSGGQRVPAEVQALVDSAAREVAESSLAISVIREVENVAKRLGRSSPEWRDAAQAVTSFSDLPLLQEAEYLAAKKKALQVAGFSSDDAMRILVAEVTAAAPRRRTP